MIVKPQSLGNALVVMASLGLLFLFTVFAIAAKLLWWR